jgi:hypothetical protein
VPGIHKIHADEIPLGGQDGFKTIFYKYHNVPQASNDYLVFPLMDRGRSARHSHVQKFWYAQYLFIGAV